MLFNEVILLETLCFDLTTEHPHIYLQKMEAQLNSKSEIEKGQYRILKRWISFWIYAKEGVDATLSMVES